MQHVQQMYYRIYHCFTLQLFQFFLITLLQTVESANTFEEAVEKLQNVDLLAPVYYIIAGTGPGEGAVLSRDREGADVWRIDPQQNR